MTTPSPRTLAGSPLVAALVVLLAAVTGGVAGIALDRMVLMPHMFHGWHRGDHDRGDRDRGGPRPDVRGRIGRELGLTPAQQARVDSIMDREMRGVREVRATVQPRLDSIVTRTRRELDAVLTPEQRQKAEEMRKRHPRPGSRGGLPGEPPPDGGGRPPPPARP